MSISFEMAPGGIEPPSPRLIVWSSTARSQLPTSLNMGTILISLFAWPDGIAAESPKADLNISVKYNYVLVFDKSEIKKTYRRSSDWCKDILSYQKKISSRVQTQLGNHASLRVNERWCHMVDKPGIKR